MQELKDQDFSEKVINHPGVSVIDFWAPWCGPCRMLGPIFEQAADTVGHKAQFFKMNIEEDPYTAGTYGVSSIPTLILFKDGHLKDQIVGVRSKDDIVKWVEKFI